MAPDSRDLPIPIIDAHCHIASFEHIPKSFIEGSIQNVVALFSANRIPITESKVRDKYYEKMQDPLCEELVAEMADAGISKTVLLAADFTYALRDCKLTIEESFLRHHEVLALHPGKFEVFGGVDPRWGKDAVDLFERSLRELGFRGFKVYPPCGFAPNAPELFPFYELCAQYRVPVLIHIGPTSPVLHFDTARPMLVDEAARLFPAVNFILAHGSVSFVEECAMMCRFRPNVYLDISAFQTTLSWNPAGGALSVLVSQGICHKIVFGTDWPVFRLQGDQASFVEFLIAEDGPLAELNDAQKAQILHGNAERLLGEAQILGDERP